MMARQLWWILGIRDDLVFSYRANLNRHSLVTHPIETEIRFSKLKSYRMVFDVPVFVYVVQMHGTVYFS